MVHENIKSKYPIFSAYGDSNQFLDSDACLTATADERIRSIWRFMQKQVMNFHKTLRPRERVNFDPEDTMTELYVSLVEKDAGWIPERGTYITFAGTIIERELCSIRDRSRTVESPRNSNCRMKEYKAEEEAGTLTDRRRRTAAQIVGTSDISPIASSAGEVGAISVIHDDPSNSLLRLEDLTCLTDAVKTAIWATLTPLEAKVIGRLFGLWGKDPRSVWQIEFLTGIPGSEVRKAKISAIEKMRAYLLSVDSSGVVQELASKISN